MSQHPVEAPPRELTDEEAEKRSVQMFGLEQTMIAAIRKGNQAAWEFAKAASEFEEEHGWSALGYDTLSEWLAQPDVGVSRTWFYRLVRVYRELTLRKIDKKELPTLDANKVDIVLGTIKAGETDMDDVLDDVRTLGRGDLREKYWGEKPNKPKATVPPEARARREGLSVDELNKLSKGEVLDAEPAHNGDAAPSGQVPTGSNDMLEEAIDLLWDIYNAYAAPEKKKISRVHREAMDAFLAKAEKMRAEAIA
jgi:hypothetical protein